jgi:hypothetical protein
MIWRPSGVLVSVGRMAETAFPWLRLLCSSDLASVGFEGWRLYSLSIFQL